MKLIQGLSQQKHVVAAPVLLELFHMTRVQLDYTHVRQVLASTRKAFHMEVLTDSDLDRSEEIMSN